jgi:hypothetical protein
MPRAGRREYRRMVKPLVSRIADTLAIARCYEQTLCHGRRGLMGKGPDQNRNVLWADTGRPSEKFASAAAFRVRRRRGQKACRERTGKRLKQSAENPEQPAR